MKFNFTIVASVVAVALMIGCALVPFTYGQDSPQAAPVNEVTGDGAVLPELPDFGALLPAELKTKLGMESKVIEVDDIYVPIENTISDYNAISIIDSDTIANGQVKALYGNGTAFDGEVTVKSGGTIVLFPEYNANDYTLNYSAGTKILLESGSIVNIFGLSFRYVNDDPSSYLVFFENNAGGVIKKTTDGDNVTDEIIVNAGGSLDIDSVADVYNSTSNPLSAFKFTYQKADGAGFNLTNGNLTVTSIQTVDGTTDTSVKDLKVSSLSVSFADKKIKIAEKGAEFKFKFEKQMSGSEKQTVSDIEITAPEINVDAKVDAKCEKSGKCDLYDFSYSIALDVNSSSITVSKLKYNETEIKGLVVTLDGTNTFNIDCKQSHDEDRNSIINPTVYANLNITVVLDELTVGGAFEVLNHGIEVKIKADKFNIASEGTSDAPAENIRNIDGKASLAATVYATEIESMAYNLGFSKIVLNFDVSASYNKTVTPVMFTVDVKDSIELTNLDIDSPDTKIGVLKGVNFVTKENFRIVINSSTKEQVLTGDASLRFSFAYDGMERPIALNLTGINYKKSVDDQKNTITELKAGKINADCDLPLKTLAKLIPSIKEKIPEKLLIDISASIVAEDLNIMKKTSSKDVLLEQSVTAKKLSATVGSGILPSIEKLNLELSEFSVEQESTAFTAKNLTGYLKNYGKEQQNFSGSDVSFGMGGSGFALINGSYTFNSGFLPMPMYISEDVTFNANGLSALSFDFEEGAVAKGKVSFNTAESLGAITRSVTMGGNNVLTIEGYQAFELPDCGYTVSLDLEALNGTLTAGKGYMLPEYIAEYGPEWTVVDKTNATFTVPEGGATYTFACVALEYDFSYSGGEVVKKAYREEFSLNALEAGQVAWFDGFKLWYEADLLAYNMPARDVVMTPIYNETPTPEESGEGEYFSLFVKTDKGSATVDNASIASIGNNGTLTLEVSGVKVVMGKTTLDALDREQPGLTLRLTVVKASQFDDDIAAGAAAGGNMYSIDLTTDDGTDFDFRCMESFLVTVNVPAPDSPSSFDIKYVTDEGIIKSVGIVNVNFLGDGTADVTFECNHFSSYAIVPVYEDSTTSMVLLFVGLLVAAIVAVILIKELK